MTFGTSYAHHSLKADLAYEISLQRRLKVLHLGRVCNAVEAGEVEHCSTGILWYASWDKAQIHNQNMTPATGSTTTTFNFCSSGQVFWCSSKGHILETFLRTFPIRILDSFLYIC